MTYKPSQELLDRAAKLGKPLINSHLAEQKRSAFQTKQEIFSSGGAQVGRYFWPKVDVKGPDECWPWKHSTQAGYGRVIIHRQVMYSHRVAAILHGILNGPSDPHQLRLTCDNKLCCNPSHMRLHDPLPIPFGASQPAVLRGTADAPPARRVRGPNKRKSVPTGWSSKLTLEQQMFVEMTPKQRAEYLLTNPNPMKPDKQDG